MSNERVKPGQEASIDNTLMDLPTRRALPAVPGSAENGQILFDSTAKKEDRVFNPSACIKYTLANFRPKVNRDGLLRFPTALYTKDGVSDNNTVLIEYSEQTYARAKEILADPEHPLNEETLNGLWDEAAQARRDFGQVVVQRAQTLGLAENLTQEEMEARYGTYLDLEYFGWDINQPETFINGKGKVTKTTEREIIVENTTPQGDVTVVSLDKLRREDPSFLSDAILAVIDSDATAAMANHAYKAISLHEHAPTGILFGHAYLQEIFQLPDDQREQEAETIAVFMEYRQALGLINNQENKRLTSGFETRLAHDTYTDDDSVPTIIDYASHVRDCPSEAEATRAKADDIFWIHSKLGEVVSQDESDILRPLGKATREVLHDPYAYEVRQDRREEMGIEENFDVKFAQFITDTHEITDRDQLVEALRETMPRTYQRFIDFQNWMNSVRSQLPEIPSRNSVSRFDQFINNAAKHNNEEPGNDLDDIDRFLGRGLNEFTSKVQPVKLFPNITSHHGEIVIQDPQLAGILRLLVIKKMPLTAAVQMWGTTAHELTVQALKTKQITEEKVPTLTRLLAEKYQTKSQLLEKFKQETGITDEEITAISQNTSLPGEYYDRSFGARLLALVLQKKGIIKNISTVAFQTFLNEMFPDQDEAYVRALGGK